MRLAYCAAIAAAFIFPVTTSAQQFDYDGPTSWGPRLRVTPFVGFAPKLTRTEHWLFVGPNFSVEEIYHVDLASGMAAGASVEMQVWDRFAIVGGATMISRGRTIESSEASSDRFQHAGSNFLLVKAAAAVRLREQASDLQVHSLSGTLFAGPALIREMPKSDANVPAPVLLDPLSYIGLNVGLDVQLPVVTDKLTFQAGVEDYWFHWNDAEMARRNDIAAGGSVQSYVESDPSHTFLMRAGFSLRVR
jgi:hypothetical protein